MAETVQHRQVPQPIAMAGELPSVAWIVRDLQVISMSVDGSGVHVHIDERDIASVGTVAEALDLGPAKSSTTQSGAIHLVWRGSLYGRPVALNAVVFA